MWPIIKKAVNSDLSTPLNTLINNVNSIVNNVKSIVNTINTNVGSNADAASSTGSLHAKIKRLDSNGIMLRQIKASDQLRFSSNNSVRTANTNEFVKVKSIAVMFSGTIRVSFGMKDGYGRIYKNGAPVGQLRVSGSSSTTYTEDISCSPGDSIELWIKARYSSDDAYAWEFRIYFDFNDTPIYGEVLL